MKSKQSGFTLVEIITAIVILGIILTVSIGAYNQVTKNVRETEYENKIKQIELASEKWAEENNLSSPTTISVDYLIENNYLKADEIKKGENFYYNPVNDQNIKCNTINLEIKNTSVEASYIEEEDCELVTVERESSNIFATPFKFVNNKVSTELGINGNNEVNWSNQDVIILVESDEYHNYEKIVYSIEGEKTEKSSSLPKLTEAELKQKTTIDHTKYNNVFSIKASLFFNSKLTISLYTPNEGIKNKELTVRIDKEAATATVINDNSWKSSSKTITLQGTDGNGSGLKGFYIYDTPNATIKTEDLRKSNYELVVKNLEEKKYYVWTEDNAGNISKEAAIAFEVTNIDGTKPSIGEFIVDETKLSGYSYSQKVSITSTINDTQSGIKEVGYCFTTGESCNNFTKGSLTTSGKITVKFPNKKGTYKLCVQAIDNVDNKISKCDVNKYYVDGTPASTVSSKFLTNTIDTIEVTTADPESGVKQVICRYGITTAMTSTPIVATKDGSKYICKIPNPFSNTKYYLEAETTNNSGLKEKAPVINFTPKITVAQAFDYGCENDVYCENSVKLKYGPYIFSIFKNHSNGHSYWAMTDNVYAGGYLINTHCCDQGVCNYSNSNLGRADNLSCYNCDSANHAAGYGNFTTVLSKFRTTLPATRTSKLIQTNQYTGYVDTSYNDYTTNRAWTSEVGMLNYADWKNIKNYPYARSNAVYALSTTRLGRSNVYIDHFTESEQISTLIVQGTSISHTHAIFRTYVRPLITIHPHIILDGGNGTADSPYIMN